jgi:hypothetical protein
MSDWLPIETAPADQAVIVFADGAVGEAMLHANDGYGDGEWWWANEYQDYHAEEIRPTHWMPLPEPPK